MTRAKQMDLSTLTFADCNPFVPRVEEAKVLKVHDGMTLHIGTSLAGYGAVRFLVRLAGMQCPELRSRCHQEKTYARIVRDILKGRILHRVVHVNVIDVDKYGRLVCHLSVDGVDVADMMLGEGLAVHADQVDVNWGAAMVKWQEQALRARSSET